MDERREIKSERTLTSKTFVNPDGSRTAEIHAGAIHFRDGSGALRPIDTSLVPSDEPGYAYEVASAGYELLVPAELADDPVVVTEKGRSLSFRPEGAAGSPTVEGPVVTFEDAYPGVDLVYEATPTGVRELVVVHNEESMQDFSFTLDADGARPVETADGDVFLRDNGSDVALLDSPYVYELDDPSSMSTTAVDLDLAASSNGELEVTLDISASWATSQDRDYPLVVDPTVTLNPPSQDCWIGGGSGQNDSHCAASSDYIHTGYQFNPRRGLVKFNTASLPSNANVTSANISLYLDASKTLNPSNSDQYTLIRTTKSWTNDVTWNDYDGAIPWTTPGGDFNSDKDGAYKTLSGSTSGYKSFGATELAQAWASGGLVNKGVVVKQVGDVSSDPTTHMLYFVSADSATATSEGPKLTVNYTEPTVTAGDRIGQQEFFTFETQRLNDRTELKVNVATGNLLLKQTDFSLGGTGLSYSFARFYNSLATASDPARLSSGWSTGPGATTRIIPGTGGRVTFVGPTGYRVRFDANALGGYAAAEPGIRAELRNALTGGGYKLEWHSQEIWTFDASGRLTKQEDKNGNFITFAYNGTTDELVKVTDTRGKEINFAYTNGLLTSVTDTSIGRTYTYGYTNGRLTSSKLSAYTPNSSDPNLNKTTTYTYDASGRLWKITDARAGQVVTEIGYVSSTDNRVASIERNAAAAVQGPTTQFSYFSETTGCEGADDATARTEVNGPRAETEVPSSNTDSEGDDITTYCYDEHNRVRKTIDAKGNKRNTVYTSNSNVAKLSEAGVSSSTSIGYDSSGNATSMSLPTGGTAHMSYGDTANAHLPTGVKDFAVGSDTGSNTWEYKYDNNGNLIEARAPSVDGSEIKFRYCYDDKGNLDRIDQHPWDVAPTASNSNCRDAAAQNNDTLFTYDIQGRLTKVDPPGTNATQEITQYDGASRVTQTKDGKGNTSNYTYDALDRVRQITTTNAGGTVTATITYTYDPNGNLLSRTDGSGEHLFTYDALNRMSFDDPPDTNVGTTYEYDAASNLKKLWTYGEGSAIEYTYDEVNLVSSVKDFNGRTTFFEHNDRNLRTKTTYPGGVIMESAYDDSRRLECTFSYKDTTAPFAPPTALRTDGCPKVGSSETGDPAYDPNDYIAYSRYGYQEGTKDTNRRESSTDRFGVTTNYNYDSIGRLKEADGVPTSATDYEYLYDPVGNVTKEVAGTTTTHYAFNAANELCWSGPLAGSCGSAPAGSTTYGYDAVGNLVSSSAGFSANYNVMNQTTSATAPGGSALSMSYADFTQDRRLSAGALTFDYNQLGLATQSTGGGQPDIARFIKDPNGTLVAMTHNDVDQTPSDLYYHFDGLGSVVATTNPSGNVVRRYTYEPYGKELSPNSTDYNPWRYASGYYDKQTKLLKFGTRYYDPEILRWTQRDPQMGKLNQPMTLNACGYVGGNPINATDPSGRFWDEVGDALDAAADWAEDQVDSFCNSTAVETFTGFTSIGSLVGFGTWAGTSGATAWLGKVTGKGAVTATVTKASTGLMLAGTAVDAGCALFGE